MDCYVDEVEGEGGSMMMVGKGKGREEVRDGCKKEGGL